MHVRAVVCCVRLHRQVGAACVRQECGPVAQLTAASAVAMTLLVGQLPAVRGAALQCAKEEIPVTSRGAQLRVSRRQRPCRWLSVARKARHQHRTSVQATVCGEMLHQRLVAACKFPSCEAKRCNSRW
jgi:hypothetical protein